MSDDRGTEKEMLFLLQVEIPKMIEAIMVLTGLEYDEASKIVITFFAKIHPRLEDMLTDMAERGEVK